MSFTSLKNRTQGFTLIELLVVIAIIGILSSVVLASLSTARQKSRDAKRISDLGQVQLALELYFDASQTYPTNAAGVITLSTVAGLNPTYIPILPVTPTGATVYKYAAVSNANAECNAAPCPAYILAAELERFDNTALASDADAATAAALLNGTSPLCNAVAGTTVQPAGGAAGERCYDLHS